MENKIRRRMVNSFILFIVLLSLAAIASAENITYVYKTYGGEIIIENSTGDAAQVNVTLPNTTWDMEFESDNGRFRVLLEDINATDYPVLDIAARQVQLSSQNYNGVLRLAAGSEYAAKYAYAFNISQLANAQYRVELDYTGVSNPRLFKCGFDFTTNTTSTSSCQQLSHSIDSTNKMIYATTSNFSSFFVAQFTQQTTKGGGSSGGGGGGGGQGGPRIIYINPTPEGDSAQVYQGDEIIVQYKGEEYHFRVSSTGNLNVKLRNLQTYVTHDINIGEEKSIGLSSMSARDVLVSMYVSDGFAMVTFKTIERQASPFNLLPPRPSDNRLPTGSQVALPREALSIRNMPPPAIPQSLEQPAPATQLPDSPINIWTLLLGFIFIIFLVGGIALYRVKLHHMETPPTVTRTGLERTGLPKTSSAISKPAPTNIHTVSSDRYSAKEKQVVTLSVEKKLELEKYVFHASSLGFSKDQIRQALLEKGWPTGAVDDVLLNIMQVK